MTEGGPSCPAFSRSGRPARSQPDAFLFGDQCDGAEVAKGFDDQVHRHVELVLQADFASDFFHQIGLRGFDVEVDIATFLLVVNPRAKQRDLHALAQHGLRGAFDGVDLGGGEAHGRLCRKNRLQQKLNL